MCSKKFNWVSQMERQSLPLFTLSIMYPHNNRGKKGEGRPYPPEPGYTLCEGKVENKRYASSGPETALFSSIYPRANGQILRYVRAH